ncbi:MAG: hypothetical protein PUP92_23360, partial [Rhizonema sp. PD38]|nr:hypothetical protein [Rhizonema sp. PD38]
MPNSNDSLSFNASATPSGKTRVLPPEIPDSPGKAVQNPNHCCDTATVLHAENSVQSPEVQEQIDLLKSRFLSILSPEDTGTNIIAYAGMKLKQFPLVRLTAEEVCHMAYIRSYEKVKAGEIIRNYTAWVKRVIVNILLEEKRKEEKLRKLQQLSCNLISENTEKNNLRCL